MAKKQEGAEAPDAGTSGTGTEAGATGEQPKGEAVKEPKVKEPKKDPEQLAALIGSIEPSERQMFADFMLAVAGRDDANYKTAAKVADDAAALTAEYFKRASQFKG